VSDREADVNVDAYEPWQSSHHAARATLRRSQGHAKSGHLVTTMGDSLLETAKVKVAIATQDIAENSNCPSRDQNAESLS
jgi:hypothetical protein